MEDIIIVVLGVVAIYALDFLITAGLLYLAIKILTYIGITAWKLVFLLWLLCIIIRLLFRSPNTKK